MRKVIVNSTPLISLCKVGLLDLLEKQYGEITIPEAVFREVGRKNDAVKKQVSSLSWIHVEAIKETKSRRMYKAKLHDGEVEVMILAQEHEGEHLVVIDDFQARRAAEYLGLKLTGTIGVLIKAKENGYVDAVMPVISEMEREGIYFSDKLKEQIRHISKE